MAKFELTKTIEAIKLNQRTMRALSDLRHTIPYGSVINDVTQEGDNRRFFYLGEPYECPEMIIASAIKKLE